MPIQTFGNVQTIAQSQSALPTPLFKELRPAEPIPFSALGPLQPPVEAIQTLTQAPAAIAMQSVLGTASLAAQPFANVETLNGDAPISLFLLTVAASGERKSACDKLASSAIDKIEAPRLRAYPRQMQNFEVEMASYQKKLRSRGMKMECEVIEEETSVSPTFDCPEPPMMPTTKISDPTIEGLICHFEGGNPSVAVFSDEGGQFFGGHGMKKENTLKTSAALSKLWDGATLDRMRASSPPVRLMGRRSSLHLMIQPGIAESVLGDPVLRDQGLLSRLLVSWPESKIGFRVVDETPDQINDRELAQAKLEVFSKRVSSLLETPFPSHPEDKKELCPRTLPLSKEARNLLVSFYNRVEVAQRPGRAFEYMHGFASKSAEQAARIAGIFSIFDDVDVDKVTETKMKYAIDLMEWYLEEAQRIADTGLVSVPLRDAEALKQWLINRWTEHAIDIRTVVKRGPNHLRQADTVKQAIGVLVEYGWLLPSAEIELVDGNRARRAWSIIRP